MAKILIVEDAEELLTLVADFFRDKGSFDVDTAPDGNTAYMRQCPARSRRR